MSSWRRLHARYDAPETTGSVLRLHRGPLGFVVKIWDHLGPVFPSDHRFSDGEMVQKSALELQKREFPKIQSRLAKRVESCSARWVLVDIVTNHAKISLKVQNSASNIQHHGSEIGVGG